MAGKLKSSLSKWRHTFIYPYSKWRQRFALFKKGESQWTSFPEYKMKPFSAHFQNGMSKKCFPQERRRLYNFFKNVSLSNTTPKLPYLNYSNSPFRLSGGGRLWLWPGRRTRVFESRKSGRVNLPFSNMATGRRRVYSFLKWRPFIWEQSLR